MVNFSLEILVKLRHTTYGQLRKFGQLLASKMCSTLWLTQLERITVNPPEIMWNIL